MEEIINIIKEINKQITKEKIIKQKKNKNIKVKIENILTKNNKNKQK